MAGKKYSEPEKQPSGWYEGGLALAKQKEAALKAAEEEKELQEWREQVRKGKQIEADHKPPKRLAKKKKLIN